MLGFFNQPQNRPQNRGSKAWLYSLIAAGIGFGVSAGLLAAGSNDSDFTYIPGTIALSVSLLLGCTGAILLRQDERQNALQGQNLLAAPLVAAPPGAEPLEVATTYNFTTTQP